MEWVGSVERDIVPPAAAVSYNAGMSDLRIETEATEAATIVRLIGEGHVGDAVQLGEAFDALAETGATLVVVDMSGLTFASSLTMGALVKLRGQLKRSGGSLRMAALTEDVAGAFSRARLDWAIPTFDTIEQALEVG